MTVARTSAVRLCLLPLALGTLGLAACSSSTATSGTGTATPERAMDMAAPPGPPSPDPRIGLEPGLFDAGEAVWNLRVLSSTPPRPEFVGSTNSDLAFKDHYAIQGNYNGIQVWDISDPTQPVSVVTYVCPASQSDVSVYENLLFVSGEGLGGRLDCGTEGVDTTVSPHRLRGIRIFDISDIRNPEYVANVQTCRGSHTHSVLEHPDDTENVYVYVSGSAPVRPAEELPGCSGGMPDEDPNTALFRIEVIKVPLADPTQAAIVSSPRIFHDLVAPPRHGQSPADIAAIEQARARGAFVYEIEGQFGVLPDRAARQMLDSIVEARGGTTPTAEDSAAVRSWLDARIAEVVAQRQAQRDPDEPAPGPTQCHDITLYPAIGLAGGACGGYGLLLDINDPANPVRIEAVSDSNFSYWHSATFNNDGTKILFTDEWGGGGQPKCRASDPEEWGANAIFSIEGREMRFESYYKLPAPQTRQENCVAHNGSLIPIPGRDVMVQAWYQGGISVIDFTDSANPVEIAYFDRGPIDDEHLVVGGFWSTYFYHGRIYGTEMVRGLDVLALVPSEHLSENEIAAAALADQGVFNPQQQFRVHWPAEPVVARAYLDQLQRGEAALSESLAADLAAALDRSEARLEDGARDEDLAAELESLAAALDEDRGDAVAKKRRAALGETLSGIAARLR